MPTAIRVNWLEFPETREYRRGETIRWSAEVFGDGDHVGDVWIEYSVELHSVGGLVSGFGGGGGFLAPSALRMPAAFAGSGRLLEEPGNYELRIAITGDVVAAVVRTVLLRIRWQALRAVAFDFGHTLVDERVDILQSTVHDEAQLMPGAREALTTLEIPIAIGANTRVARAEDIEAWLVRAHLAQVVRWVITSQEANARKPGPCFFYYALRHMGLDRGEVLFVGNQLNTDIAGANGYGIRSVCLSDAAYRSADDRPTSAVASYTIQSFRELPGLVEQLERT
jgi:FMN phosphatase YigB (HAD superfamily)